MTCEPARSGFAFVCLREQRHRKILRRSGQGGCAPTRIRRSCRSLYAQRHAALLLPSSTVVQRGSAISHGISDAQVVTTVGFFYLFVTLNPQCSWVRQYRGNERSMGITCGIVGLPNVGKSTLFNAITAARAEAANSPFCTIDPNVGVVAVPDPRLDALAQIYRPANVVPTTIEFVDIAGLVRGVSKGEGLGNQFLAHIREVDAIVHVVRCFDDPHVVH